ncbi:hypothetical protein KC19_1G057100 [Ceratodon purpureus]|uniref:Fucosyltransferase n=1 Tax=Ceratodon purpureus TaxID=3225 RepID=A0A8T0J2W5_CERPU|nr:hypothetical protein KC19_1G057100 [Ceratodon purpureus]
MKGKRRITQVRYVAVPAFLLLCFAFTFDPPSSPFEVRRVQGDGFPRSGLADAWGERPVQALVGAIRSVTAGVGNASFSELDAETWRIDNPCAARAELGPRYARRPNAQELDPYPEWELVLKEYSALHRTCMRSVGNVTEYFLSGATTSNCKFLIMEIEGVGLGNKIALLISGMLYAILTQRVVLLNTNSLIPSTICEPFLGSSWLLDEQFPLPGNNGWEKTMLGSWAGWESPIWKSSKYFERGVDSTKAGKDVAFSSAVKVEFSDPEVKRFFCDTEQAFLTEPTWLHFSGCLYFLPKIFAVPAFRPALEAMFPDPSLTLTYLLRSLMFPKNNVWEQVKQHDKDLFADVDRRVGIQVRFLYGRKVYFRGASKRANDHVKQCVAENNILPSIVSLNPELQSSEAQSGQVIRVLVTSLHTALTEELLRMYENHRTATGDTVKVTQLTQRGKQGFSADEDIMAMVEILLLSFVDELLVTPLSTFGGLAQAYGGIRPWFVDVKNDDHSCVRAQSVDLCYQASSSRYECPHDPDVDSKEIQSLVPHMRICLPIEENYGVQLVSPNHVP